MERVIALLKDLNPRLKDGVLVFDCPGHCDGRIRVPIRAGDPTGKQWQCTGELPNLSLAPSVNAEPCCHVNIVNGQLRAA